MNGETYSVSLSCYPARFFQCLPFVDSYGIPCILLRGLSLKRRWGGSLSKTEKAIRKDNPIAVPAHGRGL